MTSFLMRSMSVCAVRIAFAGIALHCAVGTAHAAVRSADFLIDARTMPWKSNAQLDDYLPYGIYDGRYPGVLGRFHCAGTGGQSC